MGCEDQFTLSNIWQTRTHGNHIKLGFYDTRRIHIYRTHLFHLDSPRFQTERQMNHSYLNPNKLLKQDKKLLNSKGQINYKGTHLSHRNTLNALKMASQNCSYSSPSISLTPYPTALSSQQVQRKLSHGTENHLVPDSVIFENCKLSAQP